MKYNVESAHLFLSLSNEPKDTGRNRFELVLQTRDPNIDSDLAWSDHKVLETAIIGGASGGFSVTPGVISSGIFAAAASPSATTRVVNTRAGKSLSLNATLQRNLKAISSVTNLLDPVIWNVSAELGSTEGKPARLLLREFERYYTDHAKAEKQGTSVYQRRVVEERLVYASILEF